MRGVRRSLAIDSAVIGTMLATVMKRLIVALCVLLPLAASQATGPGTCVTKNDGYGVNRTFDQYFINGTVCAGRVASCTTLFSTLTRYYNLTAKDQCELLGIGAQVAQKYYNANLNVTTTTNWIANTYISANCTLAYLLGLVQNAMPAITTCTAGATDIIAALTNIATSLETLFASAFGATGAASTFTSKMAGCKSTSASASLPCWCTYLNNQVKNATAYKTQVQAACTALSKSNATTVACRTALRQYTTGQIRWGNLETDFGSLTTCFPKPASSGR